MADARHAASTPALRRTVSALMWFSRASVIGRYRSMSEQCWKVICESLSAPFTPVHCRLFRRAAVAAAVHEKEGKTAVAPLFRRIRWQGQNHDGCQMCSRMHAAGEAGGRRVWARGSSSYPNGVVV